MIDEFVSQTSHNLPNEKRVEGLAAFYILAKFREQRAFPYAVRLCSLPAPRVDYLLNDINVEKLSSILASTYNGDNKTLYSIITNQYLYEPARMAALDTYIILCAYKIISRKQILTIFTSLFKDLASDFSDLPTFLVLACSEIYATELFEYIKKYFKQHMVEEEYASLHEIEDFFSNGPAVSITLPKSDYTVIDDLEKQMGWLFEVPEEDENDEDVEPFIAKSIKIDRNAPCPCNSGKKYKKCCLNNPN